MKGYVVIAVICALIAIGFLCATIFTTGAELVYTSIGAGLALIAFIILFVAYVNKAAK